MSLLLFIELIGAVNDNAEETRNVCPSISVAVYIPIVTGSGLENITSNSSVSAVIEFISAGTLHVKTLDCTVQLNSTVLLGQTTTGPAQGNVYPDTVLIQL